MNMPMQLQQTKQVCKLYESSWIVYSDTTRSLYLCVDNHNMTWHVKISAHACVSTNLFSRRNYFDMRWKEIVCIFWRHFHIQIFYHITLAYTFYRIFVWLRFNIKIVSIQQVTTTRSVQGFNIWSNNDWFMPALKKYFFFESIIFWRYDSPC